MTTIAILAIDQGDPLRFEVRLGDGERSTRHEVSLSKAQFDSLCSGLATPEQCVRAAFSFLLDREPADAILNRFDIAIIGSYFPEFTREFQRYLSAR